MNPKYRRPAALKRQGGTGKMRFQNLNPAAQINASKLTAIPPFHLWMPQAFFF